MTRVISFADAYIVDVLYWAIFLVLLSVIALLVLVVVHKLYVERRTRRLAAIRERYRMAIVKKLARKKPVIEQPATRIEFEALSDALIEALADKPDRSQVLGAIARNFGVVVFYTNQATSRSWAKRYLAIERLGLLKLPEMRSLYRNVLAHETDVGIIAKAVWALSFVAEEDDLGVIDEVLNRPLFMSAKFAEYIYANIVKTFVRRGHEECFVQRLQLIKDDPAISIPLVRAAIEACGSEALSSASGVIVEYYWQFEDSPDIKITCLRALGEIGDAGSARVIRDGLADEDWRVRAVAVKSAGAYSEDMRIGLQRSLHDENYHVRINAALSLSKLGDGGLAALKRGARSKDRFVRDVASYVLKELSARA